MKDVKLGWNATGLRKFEVNEMPFDNIRIGAFYESMVKGEEKDDDGNGKGYITYSNLKKELMDNDTWMKALKSRA